jgi:hypothetical protein
MTKSISLRRSVFRIALSVIVAASLLLGAVPAAQQSASHNGSAVYAADKGFTGWKTVQSKVYYYAKGKKANGFRTVKNKTYYFQKGISQKGWQTIGNKKYYFKKAAKGQYAMVKGLQKIGKSKYYFGEVAKNRYAMRTGFRNLKKAFYRWDNKGHLFTTYKKTKYYFDTDGKMVVANSYNGHVLEVDGKYYYVLSDGAIDPEQKILYFERFKNNAWIRVIADTSKNSGRVMIKFGDKDLDVRAYEVWDAIESTVDETNTRIIAARELYNELFRYKWTQDKIMPGFICADAKEYVREYIGIRTTFGTYWGAWGAGNED